MTDQSVFGEASAEPQKPSLEDLVGEGKKYATTEDALKSVPDKEFHIQRLERQAEEMRQAMRELEEKANSGKTLEEVLERLNKEQDTTRHTTEESNQPDVSVFERKLEELQSQIPNTYKQLRAQEQAEANEREVHTALTQRYGDRARDILHQRAQELGVSVARMKEMAQESPRAVLELFPQKGANPGQPSGDLNTGSQERSAGRTFKDYQKLRRENPSEYFSPKVQRAMMQDAKELGDKFYT